MTAINGTDDDDPRPPYGLICDELLNGGVVPFLGAGASIAPRVQGEKFDGKAPKFLPKGLELAEWLSSRAKFPEDPDDLAQVASYIEWCAGRPPLARQLRHIFSREYPCLPIHYFLADIPKPMLIVTTNYDDLIERAFQERGKPYHLVTYPNRKDLGNSVFWWKPGAAEPESYVAAALPLKVEDTSVIFKMHGSVFRGAADQDRDNFVISEEDYVRFLARMATKQGAIPSRFMLHLRNSSLLFLGYGLRDWNFRVMFETLSQATPPPATTKARDVPEDVRTSWAIQYEPSLLEKSLWGARKVRIFNEELSAFAVEMRKYLE